MPVILSTPKQSITLDMARIVHYETETNEHLNQFWLDIYFVYGRYVDGAWEQHVDPADAAIAQYIRVRDGFNPHARPSYFGQGPLGDGLPLGQCEVCGVWHAAKKGACTEDGCGGLVQPYDGFTRFAAMPPAEGATNYEVNRDGLYTFLTTEQAPDPKTGEIRPLLAATME